MQEAADKAWVGQFVRVFVSGRHDFVRKAQVLAVRDDELLVRYDPAYGRSDEWIPARWL